MAENKARLLLKGSSLRLLTLLINVGIALYMMPFLITNLGDRWYGLWVIVGAVMGYYGLLDFGLSTATQRYVAKSLGKSDMAGVSVAMSTSFVLFSILSLVAVLLTSLIVYFGDKFFPEPGELEVFQFVMLIMGAKVVLSFPLYTFNGIISAKLRYDIASYIELFKLLLRSVLIIVYINLGYSIEALAVITFLVEILGHILITLYAYRLCPGIQLRTRYCNIRKAAEYYHYGKYVFISTIADTLRFKIDNLVITYFISLSAVTQFNIALRLADYLGQVFSSIIGVVMPTFASDYGKGDWDNIRRNFSIVSEIAICISIGFAGTVIFVGDEFIVAWVGEEYMDVYNILFILVVGSGIAASHAPCVSILYAISKHKYYAYMTLIEAFFNLGLSLILIQYIGLIGVALGTFLPVLVTKMYFQPKYTCQMLGYPFKEYYSVYIRHAVFGAGFFFLVFLMGKNFAFAGYSGVIVAASLVASAYFLISLKYIISSRTKQRLAQILPDKLYFIIN